MILEIVGGIALLAAGFGAGRVKNKAKLAAITAAVTKAENTATTDVQAVIAEVKSKL